MINFEKLLRKEVKKLKEKIKPQHTVLEKQFNTVKEIYDLNHEEYEVMMYLTLRDVNNIYTVIRIICKSSNTIGNTTIRTSRNPIHKCQKTIIDFFTVFDILIYRYTKI